MEAQPFVDGAVENHVNLVLNGSGGTTKTGSVVAGSFDFWGQVAFAFNAKVMAATPKTTKGGKVCGVGNFMQVGRGGAKGQVGPNES